MGPLKIHNVTHDSWYKLKMGKYLVRSLERKVHRGSVLCGTVRPTYTTHRSRYYLMESLRDLEEDEVKISVDGGGMIHHSVR